MVAVIILLVLLILGELFTLMLQCRRGHSAWGLLRLFRYAHRGYHDKPRIPENSMAAFRRAIENGFGAELDVHLMKDGRLAVIHDASLKRTAGADVLVSGAAFFGHPPYDQCHQNFQAAAQAAADNAHNARCAAAALWQPGRALKK